MGTMSEVTCSCPRTTASSSAASRYMLSIINLDAMAIRSQYAGRIHRCSGHQSRYWQFANRHNPYLDVRYTGATRRPASIRRSWIPLRSGCGRHRRKSRCRCTWTRRPDGMTVWPIYAFPYATSTQSVDLGQLKPITTNILAILSAANPPAVPLAPATSRTGADQRTGLASSGQSLHHGRGDRRGRGFHDEHHDYRRGAASPTVRSGGQQSQSQLPRQYIDRGPLGAAERPKSPGSAERR